MPVKRLKNKLLSMEPGTSTYCEMYDGQMWVCDPQAPDLKPWQESDPTYYYEDVGFEITATHKLAQDKPTVVAIIPCYKMGIDCFTPGIADLCLRELMPYIDELNKELYNRNRPDNENGRYYLHSPKGEILPRNTAYFAVRKQKDYENCTGSSVMLLPPDDCPPPCMCLHIMLQVQFPKRKIRKVIQMLCKDLPEAILKYAREFDTEKMKKAHDVYEKQEKIRAWLKRSDYCAFVANGSILPRKNGTHLPLEGAVPFVSTPEDEIEICGVMGMGIKKGVTVITGGGYSGKSTLIDAISAGVYNHVIGDGRELCITDEGAVTVSCEDGRGVRCVNISPFIKWLPSGSTSSFSTDHASGSTSQAANIVEAIDTGATLLLIDEDKSATNFMIRDTLMKELIEKEPITPFTDRVRELYEKQGVSTILVIGGSGEYLSVSDRVYMMEDYKIYDVTAKARALSQGHGVKEAESAEWGSKRTLLSQGFTSYPENSGSERLFVSDMGFIAIGDECVDVRGLHNIVSVCQLDALGFMLRWIEVTCKDRVVDLCKRVDELYGEIEKKGVDFVYSSFFTQMNRFLDLPRKQELYALINRLRRVKFEAGLDGKTKSSDKSLL